MTGSTRNRPPQPTDGEHDGRERPTPPARPQVAEGNPFAGERTEAMAAPPADFLAHAASYLDDAEELAPDEVLLDDDSADAVEVEHFEDEIAVETATPPPVLAQPAAAANVKAVGAEAKDTAPKEAAAASALATVKATVEGVLQARAAAEDATAMSNATSSTERPPPVSVPPMSLPPVSVPASPPVSVPAPPSVPVPISKRAVVARNRVSEAPVPTPRMPAVAADLPVPTPRMPAVAIEPPVHTPRMPAVATEPAVPTPRMAAAAVEAATPRTPEPRQAEPALPQAAPGDLDFTATREMPRPVLPVRAKPPRPSPVPLPPEDEVTPTGRITLPPPRAPLVSERAAALESPPVSQRPGRSVRTDPMMRAAAAAATPASVPRPSSPPPELPAPALPPRREGTDPMMQAPAPQAAESPPPPPVSQRPVQRREGTDPMMRVPAPQAAESPPPPPVSQRPVQRREGTDPMMRAPAPKPSAPMAPAAAAPVQPREGTDPLMRPQEATQPSIAVPTRPSDEQLATMTGTFPMATLPEKVLPFRARTGTIPPERPPADLTGVLPFRPAGWVQPPLPQGLAEHADPHARITPADPIPVSRRDSPYAPVGPAQPAGAIAGSYPPAPAPATSTLAPVESPSGLSIKRREHGTATMAAASQHDALPFHSAPPSGHSAPQAQAPPPAPPAPPPPAPPSRPAALPTDSWKLLPSATLYPFAPFATPPVQAQPDARVWAGAPQPAAQAQSHAVAAPYVQPGADQGMVVPASLGLQVSRLTLEQYACLAAELAHAPANGAQVRGRYGLDDNAHLAEQGLWQRRFSQDSQLFASYSSLFQHYREWLNQNQSGRR